MSDNLNSDPYSRRAFLARASHGFGAMALWRLLARDGFASAPQPHSTPEAESVIFIFMMENPVHVHDLQATILHLLGINHELLIYRHAGRDYRLTDVEGRVVKEILA